MAYPPAIYPPNRQDDTPSATNHPSDHNQLSRAVSDIINELGNNPSGPQGTLQQRIGAVESGKLARDGSQAMTGVLTLDGTDATGANAAMRRSWIVANMVNVDGDTMTGTLRVGGDPGSATGCEIYPDGRGFFSESDDGPPVLALRFRGAAASANGNPYIRFTNTDAGNITGTITKAGPGSVAYNTGSDPRLKDYVGPITDAAARIQQLAAAAFRGTWKDDTSGEQWDMLYSTDIDLVAPYAVTGEADAVEEGTGRILPQQVDYSSLVPLLVSALGNALDRIAALELAS